MSGSMGQRAWFFCISAFVAMGVNPATLNAVVISPVNGACAWDVFGGSGNTISANIPTSSPGSAFTIDYTSDPAAATHIDIAEVLLTFSCQTNFTTANILLNSSPTVFSFTPTTGNSSFVLNLYDPAWISNPGTSVPSAVLPQAWKDELADGKLNASLWVNGAPWAPQSGQLMAQVLFVTPEPATISLLALGGLLLGKRRP